MRAICLLFLTIGLQPIIAGATLQKNRVGYVLGNLDKAHDFGVFKQCEYAIDEKFEVLTDNPNKRGMITSTGYFISIFVDKAQSIGFDTDIYNQFDESKKAMKKKISATENCPEQSIVYYDPVTKNWSQEPFKSTE